MSEQSRLAAVIDGVTLGEEEARVLWTAFSAHMDAHQGDMAGFARRKGWFAVAPEYRQGKAVLLVRTTEGAPLPPPPKAPPRPKPAGKRPGPGKPKGAPAKKGAPARKAAPAKKGAAAKKAGAKPKR